MKAIRSIGPLESGPPGEGGVRGPGLEAVSFVVAAWLAIAPIGALAAETPAMPGPRLERATFAGGCFWCMVPAFDKLEGVLSVESGYTGGHVENPTYDQVSAGGTGHAEAVQILYDPEKISYERLLDVFWHNVDPIAINHQFCDYGDQYRSEIFYHSEKERRLAEQSKAAIEKASLFNEPITTRITPASAFYRAEDYHQNFYKTHPIQYRFYRYLCGRDQRLEQLWGKPQSSH